MKTLTNTTCTSISTYCLFCLDNTNTANFNSNPKLFSESQRPLINYFQDILVVFFLFVSVTTVNMKTAIPSKLPIYVGGSQSHVFYTCRQYPKVWKEAPSLNGICLRG